VGRSQCMRSSHKAYFDWLGFGLGFCGPTGNGIGVAPGSIVIAALAFAFAMAEPTEFGISEVVGENDRAGAPPPPPLGGTGDGAAPCSVPIAASAFARAATEFAVSEFGISVGVLPASDDKVGSPGPRVFCAAGVRINADMVTATAAAVNSKLLASPLIVPFAAQYGETGTGSYPK
jgi:hypothetical protein